MIGTTLRRWGGILLLGLTAGCGALDVSNPGVIEDSELNGPNGAEMLRLRAVAAFNTLVMGTSITSGALTDELFIDPPFYYAIYGYTSGVQLLDRRDSQQSETYDGGFGVYAGSQSARYLAMVAMPKIRAYMPAVTMESRLSEMYSILGYVGVTMAEQVCPGFPLHSVVDYKAVIDGPLTTDQAFERGLADLDSALMYAPADSARLVNLIRVARGRALVGLGRYDEAAAAVASVPAAFVAEVKFDGTTAVNDFALSPLTDLVTRGMSDREGGNGLDFVSANDPRLLHDSLTVAVDSVTIMYGPHKYATRSAPLTIASYIEARLIQAEAALNANDDSWLDILNDLRANNTIAPGMGPLGMPATQDAKVDLLFRERAFWLWGTGHRLGDLRRLISRYNRAADDVFPVGPYRQGGTYLQATSAPFSPTVEKTYNPAVTGCTAR